MTNNYPLLERPARTKAPHDTSHGHRVRSWFLHNNAGSDDHQAIPQGPGHALNQRASHSASLLHPRRFPTRK
jgi:hypothetical protein